MLYITGDIHGSARRIVKFAKENHISRNDTIIILGDVGANYYLNERDAETKRLLNSVKATVFCIHGNHECRPEHIPSYRLVDWHGGKVWVEEEYPKVLFAKDGEVFDLEGRAFLVIGGAYSVDRFWRLRHGAAWWRDEQPSDATKAVTAATVASRAVDFVLSHTCPRRYEPIEVFLPGIDQSSVDTSTEDWLDGIEEQLSYKAWFCGHWHTNKRIDKMHFLFESWECIGEDDYHEKP